MIRTTLGTLRDVRENYTVKSPERSADLPYGWNLRVVANKMSLSLNGVG